MNCRSCQNPYSYSAFKAPDTHGRHVIDAAAFFGVEHCRRCGAYFLGEIETDEAYYRKHYPKQYHADETSGLRVSRLIGMLSRRAFRAKARLILRNTSNAARPLSLLDIGCGEGNFLESLEARHFSSEGLEPHPEACRICQSKGLNVRNADLGSTALEEGCFDVVTLWHVLEHLPQPQEALNKIRRALKPGGVVALSVPNTQGLGFRWGGTNWFHLDAPRHLTWFHTASLHYLLRICGFSPVASDNLCYEFPLDLFWSLRSSPSRWLVYPLYPIFKCLSREILIVLARKA